MEPTDLTIEILKSIRDGVHATNARIDQLRTEVTERFERAERRQAESEVRVATEIVAVVHAIGEVKDVMLEDRRLRRTVEDHESRIQALERRLPT